MTAGRSYLSDVAVTLSHDLGRISLLERENAALLNAVLHDLAVETVAAFRKAIAESGIEAPLFLTQNDGTVMQAETAIAFPVMSFASGATNSMRGAAHLSGLDDALVVDVGGTTSDIGQLRHGFPREANAVVEIGGVRTLLRWRLSGAGNAGRRFADRPGPFRRLRQCGRRSYCARQRRGRSGLSRSHARRSDCRGAGNR
jgi:N-methylhydantoinase A/oxoprolinase/acetone carboxylase beta subunit